MKKEVNRAHRRADRLTYLQALATGLGGHDPAPRRQVVDEHLAGLAQQPVHLLMDHLGLLSISV
jgi:hypothetical protein